MFGNLKHWGRWLPIALGIWAVCAAAALAAKPVTPAYTIVPFVSPLPPQGCTSAQSEIQDRQQPRTRGRDSRNSASSLRTAVTRRSIGGFTWTHLTELLLACCTMPAAAGHY